VFGCKLGPIFRKRLVIFCQKLVRTGQAAPQFGTKRTCQCTDRISALAGERTLCCFIGKSAQRSERAGHPLASQRYYLGALMSGAKLVTMEDGPTCLPD
jgi:hypothetical protein